MYINVAHVSTFRDSRAVREARVVVEGPVRELAPGVQGRT